MVAGFFEHGKDLLALYAGKSVQKIFDRITVLQMVEKALQRHARANENGRASQYVGIGMDDLR